jgi:hypothetical protein
MWSASDHLFNTSPLWTMRSAIAECGMRTSVGRQATNYSTLTPHVGALVVLKNWFLNAW